MRLWRICIAFACTVGLLLAAPPVRCLPWFSRGNIAIPFKKVRGLIVSEMSLNGRPAQNFVIDTGAFTTVLNASAVDAEGLKTISAHGVIHSFAGNIPLTRAVPQATIFGYGFQISGGASVFDLNPLQQWVGIPLTGIIGADTITSRPILIDYRAQKITMFLGKRMPDVSKADRIALESTTSGSKSFNSPVIAAQAQLPDGRIVKLNLEIDTGNVNGLTPHEPFARKYGLLADDPKQTVTRIAIGGDYDLAPASVSFLRFGKQEIAGPDTLCDEQPTGIAGTTETDGEVGYKVLSRFRVLINAPQHYVAFEPQ